MIKGVKPQAIIGWSQPYNWPNHNRPGAYISMLAKTKAAPYLKIFLSQFNLAMKPKAIMAKQ